MYTYSERPGTLLQKKLKMIFHSVLNKEDLSEIIVKQREHSQFRTAEYIG